MEVEPCNRLWEGLLRGHRVKNFQIRGPLTIYQKTDDPLRVAIIRFTTVGFLSQIPRAYRLKGKILPIKRYRLTINTW